jgi:hypothetical protein
MSRIKNVVKRLPFVKRTCDYAFSLFVSAISKALDEDAMDIRRELQKRALKQTADYVEKNLLRTMTFNNKFSLLEAALKKVDPKNGLFLEFGVYKGETINFIASKIKNNIYGFDSFEGLPEDWRDGFDKGFFKMDEMPKVRNNVVLYKGWFRDTLPKFLKEHKEDFAFIHFDCDLYLSTRDILDLAGDRIMENTICVFDEYFNYPGWRSGEHKAFQEFVKSNGIEYKYIGYCKYNQQVAIEIAGHNDSVKSDISISEKSKVSI